MPLAEHLPPALADGGLVVFETAAGIQPALPLPYARPGATVPQLTVYEAG